MLLVAAFLGDAMGADTVKENFDKMIGEVFEEFIMSISQAAKRMTATEFIIVKPLKRPRHKWYQEVHNDVCKFLLIKTVELKSNNISMIDWLLEKYQNFYFDQIHLEKDAGKAIC